MLASLESADRMQCIDLFRRADGSFGFEQFRGEADGDRRWHSLGRYGHLVFVTGDEALQTAKGRVPWLSPTETWRW